MPQCSVLRPLLFLIHINNIIKTKTENTEIRLFADDTIIYTMGSTIREVEKNLKISVRRMEDWLNENNLKMNVDKTKSILMREIRTMVHREIEVNTRHISRIEMVNEMKFPGVIIDDRLSFKEHCEYVLQKTGKKLIS